MSDVPPIMDCPDEAILRASQRLHHVGIIQPDFETAATYMATLGHVEVSRGYVEPFECWCLFCAAPAGGAVVEIVVPTGGSLARFNKGAGGLHHYALETPDLGRLQRVFEARGGAMLLPEPVKGAGNFLCNFLSPMTTRGVIVEYVQLLAP